MDVQPLSAPLFVPLADAPFLACMIADAIATTTPPPRETVEDARALVPDPKVLFLNEPSQGLAPLVVREPANVIRRLREENVTILLVEQNMKLAEAILTV